MYVDLNLNKKLSKEFDTSQENIILNEVTTRFSVQPCLVDLSKYAS